MFEKTLREKVSQENSGVRWELGQLQQQLEVSSRDSLNPNPNPVWTL